MSRSLASINSLWTAKTSTLKQGYLWTGLLQDSLGIHQFALKQIYMCIFVFVCSQITWECMGLLNTENRKSLCSYHELIAVDSRVSVVSRCTSVLIRGRTASHFSFLCQLFAQFRAMALAHRCQKLFSLCHYSTLLKVFEDIYDGWNPKEIVVFRASDIHIPSSKKQWPWICLVVTEMPSHNHWKETMLSLPEKKALTFLKVSLAP